jgi:hypothetical protein
LPAISGSAIILDLNPTGVLTMIDWIYASKIAGFGFLTVFVVLGILSFAVWLVSLVMYKTIGKKPAEDSKPKEEKV